MIRRILLAYDGSEPAAKAFRFSADFARNYHEALLDSLSKRASQEGIQARFELQVGHVAQQILDHAEKEAVDLIVLGHRGRGLMDRWRLGSVSHRVISYAACAVTVVR